MSVWCFFCLLSLHRLIKLCTLALRLFTYHPIPGVYVSASLRAADLRISLLLYFPSKPSVSAKSTPLCFRCPAIGSCFVLPLAAPDLAWCAKGMRLPEEFPHLLASFLILLSPTDPGSHYPSPPIVLHDNWLLLQLMYFITRHRKRQTDRDRNVPG